MNLNKKPRINQNLVDRLAKIVRDKRVTVFIDAANLYYAASKKGYFISFESILEWFRTHTQEVKLNFYTAFNPEDSKQLEFIDHLKDLGYIINSKPVKVFNDLTKGNMDIELAVDAMIESGEYDVFILISGDGDFSYLVKNIAKMGKKTVVLAVGGFTSFELHIEAENYFFLDRIKDVWRTKSKNNEQKYKIFIDQIENTDYPIAADQGINFNQAHLPNKVENKPKIIADEENSTDTQRLKLIELRGRVRPKVRLRPKK